jgi:hypothetical protein
LAEALKIHQYNAEHPTGTMHSMWSQEALAYNCIDTGDDAGLEAAFNNLITTFSNQITLPKEIFQLGQRYVGAKKSDKAERFYQYVIEKWPNGKNAVKTYIISSKCSGGLVRTEKTLYLLSYGNRGVARLYELMEKIKGEVVAPAGGETGNPRFLAEGYKPPWGS